MENENTQDVLQDERIEDIQKSIKTINDHSGAMSTDIGNIKIDVKGIKTDVSWLKRFFWITVTAAIGGLITGLLNLLIK